MFPRGEVNSGKTSKEIRKGTIRVGPKEGTLQKIRSRTSVWARGEKKKQSQFKREAKTRSQKWGRFADKRKNLNRRGVPGEKGIIGAAIRKAQWMEGIRGAGENDVRRQYLDRKMLPKERRQ